MVTMACSTHCCGAGTGKHISRALIRSSLRRQGSTNHDCSPLMATAWPNWSMKAPSDASSFSLLAPRRPFSHEHIGQPGFEFGPTLSKRAPTTSLSPLMATEKPKWSPTAPSDATSRCPNRARSHEHKSRALIRGPTPKSTSAPTTTVSPLIPTDEPKAITPPPFDAVSFCCSLHTVPALKNT